MKPADVVSVSTFRSRAHAQKAHRILDKAGIESIIRPDPMILDRNQDPTTNKRYSLYCDGAQLMVRAEDVDQAVQALQWSN
jgi:hypothetical protein